jgi:hypothetical protein
MAASSLDALADRFADRGVTSVFIYTREAHPGESYRHHKSMDDKRARARSLREHCSLRRRIVLDDLAGSAHRAYGILPNMTWIVGPGGLILYKAAWTVAADVADALEAALEQLARRRADGLVPVFSERLAWRSRDDDAFRAGLERAGPQAVSDFYRK